MAKNRKKLLRGARSVYLIDGGRVDYTKKFDLNRIRLTMSGQLKVRLSSTRHKESTVESQKSIPE